MIRKLGVALLGKVAEGEVKFERLKFPTAFGALGPRAEHKESNKKLHSIRRPLVSGVRG